MCCYKTSIVALFLCVFVSLHVSDGFEFLCLNMNMSCILYPRHIWVLLYAFVVLFQVCQLLLVSVCFIYPVEDPMVR